MENPRPVVTLCLPQNIYCHSPPSPINSSRKGVLLSPELGHKSAPQPALAYYGQCGELPTRWHQEASCVFQRGPRYCLPRLTGCSSRPTWLSSTAQATSHQHFNTGHCLWSLRYWLLYAIRPALPRRHVPHCKHLDCLELPISRRKGRVGAASGNHLLSYHPCTINTAGQTDGNM